MFSRSPPISFSLQPRFQRRILPNNIHNNNNNSGGSRSIQLSSSTPESRNAHREDEVIRRRRFENALKSIKHVVNSRQDSWAGSFNNNHNNNNTGVETSIMNDPVLQLSQFRQSRRNNNIETMKNETSRDEIEPNQDDSNNPNDKNEDVPYQTIPFPMKSFRFEITIDKLLMEKIIQDRNGKRNQENLQNENENNNKQDETPHEEDGFEDSLEQISFFSEKPETSSVITDSKHDKPKLLQLLENRLSDIFHGEFYSRRIKSSVLSEKEHEKLLALENDNVARYFSFRLAPQRAVLALLLLTDPREIFFQDEAQFYHSRFFKFPSLPTQATSLNNGDDDQESSNLSSTFSSSFIDFELQQFYRYSFMPLRLELFVSACRSCCRNLTPLLRVGLMLVADDLLSADLRVKEALFYSIMYCGTTSVLALQGFGALSSTSSRENEEAWTLAQKYFIDSASHSSSIPEKEILSPLKNLDQRDRSSHNKNKFPVPMSDQDIFEYSNQIVKPLVDELTLENSSSLREITQFHQEKLSTSFVTTPCYSLILMLGKLVSMPMVISHLPDEMYTILQEQELHHLKIEDWITMLEWFLLYKKPCSNEKRMKYSFRNFVPFEPICNKNNNYKSLVIFFEVCHVEIIETLSGLILDKLKSYFTSSKNDENNTDVPPAFFASWKAVVEMFSSLLFSRHALNLSRRISFVSNKNGNNNSNDDDEDDDDETHSNSSTTTTTTKSTTGRFNFPPSESLKELRKFILETALEKMLDVNTNIQKNNQSNDESSSAFSSSTSFSSDDFEDFPPPPEVLEQLKKNNASSKAEQANHHHHHHHQLTLPLFVSIIRMSLLMNDDFTKSTLKMNEEEKNESNVKRYSTGRKSMTRLLFSRLIVFSQQKKNTSLDSPSSVESPSSDFTKNNNNMTQDEEDELLLLGSLEQTKNENMHELMMSEENESESVILDNNNTNFIIIPFLETTDIFVWKDLVDAALQVSLLNSSSISLTLLKNGIRLCNQISNLQTLATFVELVAASFPILLPQQKQQQQTKNKKSQEMNQNSNIDEDLHRIFFIECRSIIESKVIDLVASANEELRNREMKSSNVFTGGRATHMISANARDGVAPPPIPCEDILTFIHSIRLLPPNFFPPSTNIFAAIEPVARDAIGSSHTRVREIIRAAILFVNTKDESNNSKMQKSGNIACRGTSSGFTIADSLLLDLFLARLLPKDAWINETLKYEFGHVANYDARRSAAHFSGNSPAHHMTGAKLFAVEVLPIMKFLVYATTQTSPNNKNNNNNNKNRRLNNNINNNSASSTSNSLVPQKIEQLLIQNDVARRLSLAELDEVVKIFLKHLNGPSDGSFMESVFERWSESAKFFPDSNLMGSALRCFGQVRGEHFLVGANDVCQNMIKRSIEIVKGL